MQGDLCTIKSERTIADLRTFKANLTANGWKFLGRGLYSEAYGKGNRVWKISRGNFTDATIHYLRAILNGEIKSPYAPHVFRILVSPSGGYAVLMDRLRETKYKLRKKYRNRLNGYLTRDVATLPKNFNKPFILFCQHVHNRFPRLDCDMHMGNMMVRYRTTLVLTDPFSGCA